MMKLLTVFLANVLWLSSGSALAADVSVQSPQLTSTPPGARYEVVQSTIAVKATFRLDRYTGRVWELVRTNKDQNTWQQTRVYDLPQMPGANRPRFQLFTSGIAIRHTFLIDADTGKTWVLVTGKEKDRDGAELEYRAWEPFAE
jgi:hypothetical protein